MKRRGAIIGLGNVAVHGHLPGWLARPDVEIAAVTDARPALRAVAAAALPCARWYDLPEALLAEEPLDFVDVCTPPRSHAGLIAAALRRGCHVLCEKPLVSSPDELERVTRIAEEQDRVLQTVHNWHHAPILRQAGELLREGAIGPVRRAAWETLRMRPAAASDPSAAANWRVDPALAGGGVLTDHGWHVFYVLRSWLGEARAVRATLERRRHVQWAVEDTARVHVDFDGARADVFLTWAAEQRRNRVELTGADGTLRLEDDTVVLLRADGEERWPCPPALSDGSTHPDWFGPVVERFFGAMAGADGADNLGEAAACVALEAAARESSQRGERLVAIAPRPAGARRDPAA